MTQIDYFLTTLSPYVYLAGTRPAGIAARHGARLRYRPVHFASLAPRMGGRLLSDASDARRDWVRQDLARQAARLGLPISERPMFWPTNPAPSAYAIIAAQAAVDKGAGGDLAGLAHGFSRAIWAEDRDISDDAVVQDILKTHGFDPGLSFSGMLIGAETYAANLEEAALRGVIGVPFLITGGDARFWGQDRLDDLDRHLAGGGA